MVQATAASQVKRKRNSGGGDVGTCVRVIERYSSLRVPLLFLIVAVYLYLLRIESIVYRELRRGDERAEEDLITARSLRFGTTPSVIKSYADNHSDELLTPVSRNGFLSRGSLRSPSIISRDLTIDYLELEIERFKHQNIQQHDHRPETQQKTQRISELRTFPRTIALDEIMGLTRESEGENTSPSKTPRTMVLEDIPYKEEEVIDDDESSRLDFERPFYNVCERLLSPLPTVHPTCNNIHELSWSTSEIDSALLSMKGSWRSVWKVNWDPQNRHQNSRNTDEFGKNATLLSVIFNETIAINQTITQPSSDSVVLKLLHLHRRFDHHSYEAHSTDIIVMDELTASPYVVNAYAFCGQSAVTEFASSTGRDYVKRYDIGSRERMKIARDLARGLADVQALQPMPHDKIVSSHTNNSSYDESPSIPVVFAHNDINIANTVMVNGRVKWNDFNIGVFLRKRRNQPSTLFDSSKSRHRNPPSGRIMVDTGQKKASNNGNDSSSMLSSSFTPFTEDNKDKTLLLCPAPVKYRSDMWRSPEEIKNISYVQVTQSDMYGIANILYQTMTRHQPWTYKEPGGALTTTDIANRKLKGSIPTIPEQYRNTTKRELQTLFAATNMCFFPIPEKRPTARRLAFGLGSLYEKVNQKERVTRKMILDYLLPENQYK